MGIARWRSALRIDASKTRSKRRDVFRAWHKGGFKDDQPNLGYDALKTLSKLVKQEYIKATTVVHNSPTIAASQKLAK